MKILVNLGEENSRRWLRHSRVLGQAVKPVLEALTLVDQLFIRTHNIPRLYESGVRYREEPEGTIEEFASIPVVYARGWGDCDDLAPWRCAELRESGEAAKIRIQWKRNLRSFMTRVLGSVRSPAKLRQIAIKLKNTIPQTPDFRTAASSLEQLAAKFEAPQSQNDTTQQIQKLLQFYKPLPDSPRLLYHIVVRRADGTIEDPSLLLGMGQRKAAG